METARKLAVVAAALMSTFCAGQDTNPQAPAEESRAGVEESPDRTGAGPSDGRPANRPGEADAGSAGPAGASTGQASRTPPAPYYFAHARFVLARDAEGRPLGLMVEKVLPGGRVALAGIQVGDLIHSIDQLPLDDPATFDRAVSIAEDIFRERRPQHFVITRQGRKMGLMPLGPLAPEQED